MSRQSWGQGLSGLGLDKDFSIAKRTCLPHVATGILVSRHGPRVARLDFGLRPNFLGRDRGASVREAKACRDKIFSFMTRFGQF